MITLDDAVTMIRDGLAVLQAHDDKYWARGGIPLFRVYNSSLTRGLKDVEAALAAIRQAEAKMPTLFDLDAVSPLSNASGS